MAASTKASSTARLKERLARGQRLTEDELVQLELSAVKRYNALTKEQEPLLQPQPQLQQPQKRAATPPPPPAHDLLDARARPVYHAKAGKPSEKQSSAQAEAPGNFSEEHMRELMELRELRESAQQARALLDEKAKELARVRQLRQAASDNPDVAVDLETTTTTTTTSTPQVAAPLTREGAEASRSTAAMPRPAPLPAPPPGMPAIPESSATVAASDGLTASAPPPIGQLRLHLATNHAKVLDLFREWDVDGGGTVRKVEMRRAVHSLGLEAPPSAIDALFESFDRDEGGGIRYKELCRELRREAEGELKPVVKDPRPGAGSMGLVEHIASTIQGVLKPADRRTRSDSLPSAAGTDTALAPTPAPLPPKGAPTSDGATAEAKPKTAAASKGKAASVRADPRDGVIWELISLVEIAAPWAAWQAAVSVGGLPNLTARPSAAAPSAAAPVRSLPPVRSVIADVVSTVALAMACRGVLLQLSVVGDVTAALAALAALAPLHAFAAFASLLLLLALMRQLAARVAPQATDAATAVLPLHSSDGLTPRRLAPFAHWSTLALAELLLASYASCWASPLQPFATPVVVVTAATGTVATDEVLVVARRLGSAHTLAAGSAGLLVMAAFWRALLMLLWHHQCLPQSLSGGPPTAPDQPAVKPTVAAAPAPAMSKPTAPARPTAFGKALAACCKKLTDTLQRLRVGSPKGRGAPASGKAAGSSGRGAIGGGKGRPAARSATPPRSSTPPPKAGSKSRGSASRQLM